MVNWNEAWGTVFTGLIIVFVALIALVLIVWIFGKVSSSANAKTKEQKPAPVPQKAAPVPTPAAVPAAVASDDMDEIAAVITAALAMVLTQEDSGKSYVVKSIKRVRNGGSAWRGAGLSENVRPF